MHACMLTEEGDSGVHNAVSEGTHCMHGVVLETARVTSGRHARPAEPTMVGWQEHVGLWLVMTHGMTSQSPVVKRK